MNRRELLLGAAAMAAAVTTNRAFSGEQDHMHHEGMDMHHDHKSSRNQKLIEAASDCVLKANNCLQHCIVAMGQGEKDLAACAKSSSQVAAICTALQQLASAESKNLPQLAGPVRVAIDSQYQSDIYALPQARVGGFPNTRKVGSFSVTNVRASYPMLQFGKKGEVFLAVENLFGRNYGFQPGYPMPGRSAQLGLSASF